MESTGLRATAFLHKSHGISNSMASISTIYKVKMTYFANQRIRFAISCRSCQKIKIY